MMVGNTVMHRFTTSREGKTIGIDNPYGGKINVMSSKKPGKQYIEIEPVLLSFFISGRSTLSWFSKESLCSN
ncbi:MAG: hypothetical protein MR750_06655 [Methanobrevibacter boviskoreani]|uniref:hypothetical protein n=1 Tax=Methanobrevibacter boviskoreani TaxID=1348249 RepID=UPI0023A8787C|nr:hypothetical protein [Methanobrevibacter boviskoreani]MCI6930911.1 hypothetical protein [Methanobrevibacter boviskoreani]